MSTFVSLPQPRLAPRQPPRQRGPLCIAIVLGLCYNSPTKERFSYDQGAFYLPWQDLSQARHTKLCNAMPPFATGLPHLYYSHTTFQNNHILPRI